MSRRQKREQEKKREETRRVFCQTFFKWRTLLLLLLPAGILLLEVSKRNTQLTEKVFAGRIYPVLAHTISFLTGWIPFSLAEVLLILLPVAILGLLIRLLYKISREAEDGNRVFELLLSAILHIGYAVSIVFFLYVVGCGINYNRYPVSYYFGLTVEDSREEELIDLYTELAETASALRVQLSEDEKGIYQLPMDIGELGGLVRDAYRELAGEYQVFAGNYPKPKPVFFSGAMSYTEITGVFTCWTMEANVNVDISPYSIASTMGHELSHLRGFMREDEANYISYRVCMASSSPDVRYSGVMHALIHTGNALYKKNPEAYYKVYTEKISAAVSRDLVANNEYWRQFEKPLIGETTVGEIVEKVNDTYLKANRQEDGTQSYGRVVDLLLAQFRQGK